AVLDGKQYQAGNWHELGQHCSITERRADDATRDVNNWLKCFYMQDKLGEEFDGTVAGVTSFGLFVALDDLMIEGLLHVTELGNDYFEYDKMRHEMRGERTGAKYRLGDRLRVKVSRVDLETSRIDFVLANQFNAIAAILPDRYLDDYRPSKSSGQDKNKSAKTSKYSSTKSVKTSTKSLKNTTKSTKTQSKAKKSINKKSKR
ncbi:MAG: S1 RNA-binding domain-containing protein, partial [Methylophilaceae bacterium]